MTNFIQSAEFAADKRGGTGRIHKTTWPVSERRAEGERGAVCGKSSKKIGRRGNKARAPAVIENTGAETECYKFASKRAEPAADSLENHLKTKAFLAR